MLVIIGNGREELVLDGANVMTILLVVLRHAPGTIEFALCSPAVVQKQHINITCNAACLYTA